MTRRTCALLTVLTLLQLCRAEIPDSSSEKWYAANVITDGFQPKPLTELFSTETSLTNKPINVLPVSPNTPVSFSVQTSTPSGTPEITQYTGSTLPPNTGANQQSTSITSGSSQTQSQSIQFEVVPPQQIAPVQNQPIPVFFHHEQPSSTSNPTSNYFLIYQQAPQSIQGIPASSQNGISSQSPPNQSTVNIQPFTIPSGPPSNVGPSSNVGPTSTVGPIPTFRPISNVEPISTFRPISNVQPISTFRPISNEDSISTFRPISNVGPTSTTTTTNCNNSSYAKPNYTPLYPIKIRVVAPSGSITNVNINPTTKKPPTTRRTTTKRPRSPKPRKNTYDACLDGCKGRREPICGVPMSSSLLDPTSLKGFPSVCHMACHNSYRKDPYEKILDGRCGRLRTRIKTVDSDSKLKRDELNKAHYFVDSGNTVVEVQALH